jgi:hypothetical protein
MGKYSEIPAGRGRGGGAVVVDVVVVGGGEIVVVPVWVEVVVVDNEEVELVDDVVELELVDVVELVVGGEPSWSTVTLTDTRAESCSASYPIARRVCEPSSTLAVFKSQPKGAA